MKLRCPSCGSEMSLDLCLADAAARHTFAGFAALTPLARAVFRYLSLFRPASRPLSWDRAQKLVDEIVPMIASARVTRDGVSSVAPGQAWIAAIDAVFAARDAGTLRTPLKTHGYLLSIIAGTAEKCEARDEAKREERKRYDSALRTATPAEQAEGKSAMPEAIKTQLQALSGALIGKRKGG